MATEIMTLSEVAEYLRCHRTTVYRMLARPKDENSIPYFRIGSDFRFMKSAVDKWIEKRHKDMADI